MPRQDSQAVVRGLILMKEKARLWAHNLGAATITGAATSGLSALGISIADAAGAQVTALNWKQLGALAISGGVVGLLAYLKQSPLPPTE